MGKYANSAWEGIRVSTMGGKTKASIVGFVASCVTTVWLIAGASAAVVLLVGWSLMNGESDADPYREAAIDRGAITRVVSATGTLQPLVSANVGATVSGPTR